MTHSTHCLSYDYTLLEGNLINAPQIDVPDSCCDLNLIFGQDVKLTESLSPQNITIDISDQYYGISEFAIIIITLSIYLLAMYLYRNIIIDVIKSTIYSYVAKKNEDNIDTNLANYIKVAHVLFFVFVSIFIYGIMPDDLVTTFNPEFLLPGVSGAILLYLTYQKVVNFLIGYISDNKTIYENIILYNRLYKSAWILLFAPIALFSLSGVETVDMVVKYAGIAVLLCVVIQQLIRLRLNFKVENISLFQYILYLCTTEFIPISYIVVTITRKFELL